MQCFGSQLPTFTSQATLGPLCRLHVAVTFAGMDVTDGDVVDLVSRLIERTGFSREDFEIAQCEYGWVTLKRGDVRRSYPLNKQTEVLVCGDIRRGAFG